MPTILPTTPVNELPLVGPALTKAFHTLNIDSVADLLYNFPSRYMDYRKTVNIGQAIEGETVTIKARVKSIRSNFGFRGRMSYAEATLEDGTGTIKAIWFKQSYIAKQIGAGDELIVSGKVTRYKQLQLSNPAYEKLSNDDDTDGPGTLHTGRLVPIYRRADLMPLRTLRKIIRSSLLAAERLDDIIPQTILKGHGLMPINEAVRALHFPESTEQIVDARLRIAIDDVLPQQLAVQLKSQALAGSKGFKIQTDVEKVKTFLSQLPFTLTASQKRATWDIFQDMETGRPMNRLLQGDVGSGKTIVALLATLQAAGNGCQTVLLAPTEILAKQHYDTFREILGTDAGIGLLTRTMAQGGEEKSNTKSDVLKQIANGDIQICIGTHALLQGKLQFNNLGLVIIDEQHRFGVAQRGLLAQSGKKSKAIPHLLSMSATPIPRTLAMSLYAGLSVSTLSQVPTGRQAVKTFVVRESKRQSAYDAIMDEIGKGHQAFIVTPRVEDTETSEVRSVKKEFARLQSEVFPKLRLGLLYGKMKSADKDSVMADFAAGKLDILVSTSVIEIGIDIPNATAMIIEGSERFGLAQLHQLRGRIGRNNFESICFLFTTEPSHQDTTRLTALSKSNDGFALAEQDLRERGFGDLFGKQQSGFLFRFPQFLSVKALTMARDITEEIFTQDPGLKKQSHQLVERAQQYLTDIHNE